MNLWKNEILDVLHMIIKKHVKAILLLNIKNHFKYFFVVLYFSMWIIFLYFSQKYLLPLVIYVLKKVVAYLDKPLAECGNCCSKTPKNSPTEGAIKHSITLMQQKKNNPITFEYDKKEAINSSLHAGAVTGVGGTAEVLGQLPTIKSAPQALWVFGVGAAKTEAINVFAEKPLSNAIDRVYPGNEGGRPEIINDAENN